jgi:2',3'-cyclic-nucleotide 2'-phosphodiesterase (5'-nucleotidase family)
VTFPTEPRRGPRLRIVAINDVYSLENLPSLATLVAHERAVDPADVLLVTLAGDFIAPSLLSSLDCGRGMVDCMNAVGVTHAIFGNHEDDVPMAELRKRVDELHAVWLGTNLASFGPPLVPFDIVEVGHGDRVVRVGLCGVVMNDETTYGRKPFGGGAIEGANEAVLREAAHLVTAERCACVIPITHQPIDDDRALARAPQEPPFPVIVGGHEHVGFIERIAETYVIKAASEAAQAVVVDLVFPADAPLAGAFDLPVTTVRAVAVAPFPEDPALRLRVDAHMKRVSDLETAPLVILRPGEALSSAGARRKQTTLGTLVCSSLRDALGADGCLFNGGGIRGGREYERELTYGDIKAEIPFDNEIVVVKLSGRVIREAVAASRAHAPAESGGFLQVDDLMAVDDESSLVTHVRGAPIELDREYRIAVIRDVLTGMDHEEPLIRVVREHPEMLPAADSGREVKLVLVDAFAKALWMRLGGFDAVDANSDGFVTEVEIALAVQRLSGDPPSNVTANLVIDAFDRNEDRKLSRSETGPDPAGVPDRAPDESGRAR